MNYARRRDSVGNRLARHGEAIGQVGLIAALAAIAIAFSPDTKGKGNKFDLGGEVVGTAAHEVYVRVDEVKKVHGKAEDKVHEGVTLTIYDSYKDCSVLANLQRKVVGRAFNLQGRAEDLQALEFGEDVEIAGRVRDSYSRCGKHYQADSRLVFDTLTEVPSLSIAPSGLGLELQFPFPTPTE